MAINITNVLSTLQTKIGSANTSSSTQDLIYLLDAAKKSHDGGTIESYANNSYFPTANSTVKMIAFDEATRTLYFNAGGTWSALDLTVPDAAGGGGGESYTFQGSSYGYSTAANFYGETNAVDKFSFTSDGNATDVGNLISDMPSYVAGQSSSTYAYQSGGYDYNSNVINKIGKFPFASDGDATDIADLAYAVISATGHSSANYGYACGGATSPPYTRQNYIQKFPFASDGNASDVGNLTQTITAAAGQSSSTYGYRTGGKAPTYSNVIDKFPFASDTDASDVADLISAVADATGHSSADYGFSSGGTKGAPSYTTIDTCQKFSFASDLDAGYSSTLSTARHSGTGQSSTTHGYTSGGRISETDYNIIDKFPFDGEGIAADVGDLTNSIFPQSTGHQV